MNKRGKKRQLSCVMGTSLGCDLGTTRRDVFRANFRGQRKHGTLGNCRARDWVPALPLIRDVNLNKFFNISVCQCTLL